MEPDRPRQAEIQVVRQAAQGRYDTSQAKLLCFSAAGFKASLRQEAAADSDLILIDAGELYGG